jgi:peptidoglycan/xylan/chitin deacetylase (PgdA/CDA1 family)
MSDLTLPNEWWKGEKAALTLTFDDGFKSTYDLTKGLLSTYDIHATYYVPVAYIGGSIYGLPVMSWSDLKECAKLGMEVGSHSVNHYEFRTSLLDKAKKVLRNLAAEQSMVKYMALITALITKQTATDALCDDEEFEVVSSKDTIERQLHPYKVRSFAYPKGSCSNESKNVVNAAGYIAARGATLGFNKPSGADLYALRSFVCRGYTNVTYLNRQVDRALRTGAWLIEVFHVVSSDARGTVREVASPELLKKHLDYIAGKRIWIDTLANIASHIRDFAPKTIGNG